MADNFTGDFFGLIGRPMLWRTLNYGDIAVHITGISPNGRTAIVSIDGGEASTPAQHFAELSDGVGYAMLGQLIQKVRASRKHPGRAGEIRRQAEIGKRKVGAPNPFEVQVGVPSDFKLAPLSTATEVTF